MVHGFPILLLGYTCELRLHVPISWSGVNRVSRSGLAGSFVAKLADESSANGHEWVRRDSHAVKPSGSREVTHVSTATSPNPISDVTDRVLSILTRFSYGQVCPRTSASDVN